MKINNESTTMIIFYRKIRQKMLTENKFSKYLLYAIGEIILVVVGILIALSINNWNDKKNNRDFEVKMIREIDVALKEDYLFFTEHLINYRNQTELQAVAFFDKIIISKSIIVDSIDFHFNRLDFGLQPTSNRGPYDALKSSGIDKVSNDDLRKKMIYFYDFILPRFQGIIEDKLESSTMEMIPLINKLSKPSPVTISENGVARKEFRLKDIDFEKNENFNRLLYLTTERATQTKSVLLTMTPYMLELRESIKNEIEK
ncbi:DUF6090 family protein [uncultured Maribacter sp.]|uniref:DUF6090 family protein n=1 Tax=uncultured Maribacter sp. TaxID=431308 RepID=UPI0030DC207A